MLPLDGSVHLNAAAVPVDCGGDRYARRHLAGARKDPRRIAVARAVVITEWLTVAD
jgi:hypothetical protein